MGIRGDLNGRRGVGARALRTTVVCALVAFAATVSGALPAAADGPTTFANTASVAIPAAASPDEAGVADPYPSSISVSGMTGLITDVTVSLHGLTHPAVQDVDVLLVGPHGGNLVLLSDIGEPGQSTTASDVTLTFDDAAGADVAPGALTTNSYRPTNAGSTDSFPAPAPAPSAQATLADAFSGSDPNGTWSLFIVDDASGDAGSLSGGWSLSITTDPTAVATTTTVTTSGTPTLTGSSVTFTATVTTSGGPVTTGVIQFKDGATSLGGPVAVDSSGTVTLATAALAEGTHQIFAVYTGLGGFGSSTGSVSQRVDNATVVTGSTYCNPGALAIPSIGTATPYPSNITVAGALGSIVSVTATLHGLAHGFPADLDIMLSGPSPSNNILLMSDVGGNQAASDVDLTFDDAAASGVPTPLVDGTFRPTNAAGDDLDSFPAPAPAPSGATTLSTFAGGNPNGTWSLWVRDGASGDSGSISGGWCLTLTLQQPSATTVTSDLNPSVDGQSVTFTATVAAGGGPATSGTVQFSDGGTALGGAVPVSAGGTASLSTSSLAVGSHTVTAVYSGTPEIVGSEGSVVQVVEDALIADPGGPYTVAEGGSLTLDGTGSTSGANYSWDVNGDGVFGDATGATPTLTWAQLEALGIDDGPAPAPWVVGLRVSAGQQSVSDATLLTVTNTAPDTLVSGDLHTTVGTELTLKVGADDPSSADMAAQFTYTIDWGDGSAVTTVTGPADPPVSHTYATAGEFRATFVATDKDGGTSDGTVVTVVVAAAAAPASPSDSGGLPVTGGIDVTTPLVIGGGLLVIGLASLRPRMRRTAQRR